MGRKKNKKLVEEAAPIIEEAAVVEEVSTPEVIEEKTEPEIVDEEPKPKEEEPVKEIEKVEKEIEEKVSREQKIAEGAKAREEMKQAWKKRFRGGDSLTNLYSYNIGSLL